MATPKAGDRHRLLADEEYRAVVDALSAADGPLDVQTLAERLVEGTVSVVGAEEYAARRERWVASLHHKYLPKLDAAGLAEYDPETTTAERRTSAGPNVVWDDADLATAVAHLQRTAGEDGTGVVTGQANISRHGRRLTDRAEDELFSLTVSTDFLTEECLRSAERAIDRGVHVAVGTTDRGVRRRIRTQLPGATTWEPRLDWLNRPSTPRVGRFVLADRRRVMLSVLADHDRGSDDEEARAVVAHGAEHPLVVLVRDLLGERLDHLDHQRDPAQRTLFP